MGASGQAPTQADMIPEGLKQGVASILEDEESEVLVQAIGGELLDLQGNFRVLYQRDLLANPRSVERSHRKVLSKYRIEAGGTLANVPWKNIAFYNLDPDLEEVDESEGVALGSRFCSPDLVPDKVKVLWMHRPSGSVEYRWFVCFKGDGLLLTPLPLQSVGKIIRDLELKANDCKCGECRHPLLRMEPRGGDSRSERWFDMKAVRLFSKYRCMVSTEQSRAAGPKPPPPTQPPTEEGTCAVCLEDGQVRVSSCVHERCSLRVCNECFGRARGMCVLCDRIKLSDSVTFHCSACRECSPLSDFGYSCHSCGKADVCGTCHRSYGLCFDCECKATLPPRRKRKLLAEAVEGAECAASTGCSAHAAVKT